MTELILALDVTEENKAREIAHECAPYLDAIKLGYPLILSCGLSIAEELDVEDLPLIADFKVADIPNTNRLIAEQVFDAGFSSIICHGFTGKDAVQACVDTSSDYGGACFVVAEMSHGSNRILPGRDCRTYRTPGNRMRGRWYHRPGYPPGKGKSIATHCWQP